MIAERLRGCLVLAGILLGVLWVVPLQSVARYLPGRSRELLPWLFFRWVSRVMGLKIQVHGRKTPDRPVLIVGNHVSWLDIIAMGGKFLGSFVARADLAAWGPFGFMAKLRHTIFVDRERRTTSSAQVDEITTRLLQQRDVILFPEGTSTVGDRVLPFKSALFSIAERWPGDLPLTVQPVSIAYTRLSNMPMLRHDRPLVGWVGDMELAPHLWEVLKAGRIYAEIVWHQPITVDRVGGRKQMSAQAREVISESLESLISGSGPRHVWPAETAPSLQFHGPTGGAPAMLDSETAAASLPETAGPGTIGNLRI